MEELRRTFAYAKVRRNSSTGTYGGDGITGKVKDGRWRPHLSTKLNLIQAGTSTKPLREHPRQVSKNLKSGLGGNAIPRL